MSQMTDRGLEERVRIRAGGMCEYCHIPSDVMDVRFSTDHVIARQHLGADHEDNLALCCMNCNLHKGPNIAGIDQETGRVIPLFNPRSDDWDEHFSFSGPVVVGLTAVGRVTVQVLALNAPTRVNLRRSLILEGRFPPRRKLG